MTEREIDREAEIELLMISYTFLSRQDAETWVDEYINQHETKNDGG